MVFVEFKVCFDEENNFVIVEMMKVVGINIIYSILGLKVYVKVVLICCCSFIGEKIYSYVYISIGNFNEKMVILYVDCGLFISNLVIVYDFINLFCIFRGKENF